MGQIEGDATKIREAVEAAYDGVARATTSCCGGDPGSVAREIGYAEEDLAAVPSDANLGVGCGNPTALAELRPGETVLDLGSGAGFDALLAARAVGPTGRVIGVDMTKTMIERARASARQMGAENVEFRLGTIESLPVESESVDVVVSNCVVNLSPQKPEVFREAYRVLRPGGRLAVSDLVLERAIPSGIRGSIEAYVGCIGGAWLREDYVEAIRSAGFVDVRVASADSFASVVDVQTPEIRDAAERAGLSASEIDDALGAVTSLKVRARR